MLTIIGSTSAVTTGALGGSPSGGGGTPPGSKGGSYKRIRSSEAFPNEDTNGDSSLSFNFLALIRCNPNAFVSYNLLTLCLRRIGEEKEKGL